MACANTASLPQVDKTGFYPWFVLVITSCFFFYEFMQMNAMNAIDAGVREAFSINAHDLGKLAAYYAYANLIFLFPAGILLDRFSTRKIIIIAMVICTSATVLLSFAQTLQIAKLCRFLTGIGGSFCLLSCVRLASRWFPPRHMALATGIVVTLGMCGGAVAQAPLTALTEAVGWRYALRMDAALGVFIIFIIWSFVRDYPSQERAHYIHGHEVLHRMGFLHSIGLAFRNPQNWLAGLYTSLVNLPIALLGAVWGLPYLEFAHHFNAQQASLITMMLFVGTIFGSPAVGWISDKLLRRRLPMVVGAVLSLLLVLLAIYGPVYSFSAYMVLFFSLGFITSSQVISYPLIAESNPSYLTATSMSIASMIILGGYAVFQPLFGWLMDLIWHGQIGADGLRIYTTTDFKLAMLVFPIALIIAIVVACFVRETHCEPASEE